MKAQILKTFDEHTQELLQLLDSLSDEQLNKIPFQNSWTAGQVGDHLYKSYGVVEILNGNVKNTQRPPDEKLPAIRELFLDFSKKMDSPESILPSTGHIQKDSLIASLKHRINAQRDVILHQDLSLTCLDFEIPGYGPFTRFEWIGFNAVHTQRHVHQLKHLISVLSQSNSGQ